LVGPEGSAGLAPSESGNRGGIRRRLAGSYPTGGFRPIMAPDTVPDPFEDGMADTTQDLGGKTVLVTGATAGIGEVTAVELARRGASVIVVGRSPQKLDATVAKIREETGKDAADALLADLTSQSQVRRLAEQVRARHPRLDVLLNNAGAIFEKRSETVDGIERTFALNHLAYFLLTNLLLDNLKAAGAARVVNVSSEAHKIAARGINFDDIEGKKKYGPWVAYGQSKLANILFSNELARRLEGTGATSNALHPGIVSSSFSEGNGTLGWILRRMYAVVGISSGTGAKTSIHLAASPDVEGVAGGYFAKSKPAKTSGPARDAAAARRLWQVSEAMTGVPATA